MSLKKTTKKGHGTMTELNITPLLDLVFVLLVIFIITTPQLMNSLDMNLPTPNKNKSNVKPKFTRIVIDDRGGVTLNGEFVTISELKDKLGALKAENADLPVVVKGSDQVEYQKMVSVLNVLQDLSITKVGLATD